MDMDRSLRKELKWETKPTFCRACSGELQYKSHGEYECKSCGAIFLDDYGKVRKFIEVNGPSPAVIISEETGVSIDKINELLRQGRVEIPENSDIFIKCESCGTDIRYGKYCPTCAARLSKTLKGVYEAGEVPRKKDNMNGSMHFFGKDKKY